jgi:hypothetical protein
MKRTSVSKSAFLTTRALMGFGFGSIGVLLLLLAFITFPSTSALAVPGTCAVVEFTEVPGEGYGELYVQMSTDNPFCTIYYTVSATNWPPNPTHSSAVYNPSHNPNYEGLGVPHGQRRYYKAFAHISAGYPTEDSIISQYVADNTGL